MRPPKILCTALVGLLSVSALADDHYPPPWRGDAGTTWQRWSFLTNDAGPMAPDGGSYLSGTEAAATVAGGLEWLEAKGTVPGVWPLGQVDIYLANYSPTDRQKLIQIQLTWSTREAGEDPVVELLAPTTGGSYEPLTVDELSEPSFYLSVYEVTIEPSPTSEQFRISGGIDVSEVIIDTRCVPEPAALSLLAIGGLVLRGPRRQWTNC